MSVIKGYKGKWKVDITDGIDPLTGEIKRHRKSGRKGKVLSISS